MNATTSDLLAAILAAPGDLESRRVYADALEAAGDPRGTFIAAQCRLHELDELDPDYPALVAEAERLRATHGVDWLAPVFDALGVAAAERGASLHRFVFERGFLSRVSVAIETAAAVAAKLAQLEPIDGLGLAVSEWIPPAQRSFPEVARWRYLAVEPDGWFTDHSLAHALAWGPAELERLALPKCAIGVAGCRMLANLPTDLAEVFDEHVDPPPLPVGRLRSLELRGCQIGDAGLAVLAEAETLTALEHLDLSQNKLGPGAAATLRGAPALAKLRELSLAGNKELGEQLGALGGWPVLAQLRRLAIPQTAPPEALAALFPDPSEALRELALVSNKALGQRPHLYMDRATRLTSLDLGTTSLGDGKLVDLLAAPAAASLTRLKLNGCSLSDKGVAALVASPLTRLTELDLSSNKLSDAGLTQLAGWAGLGQVWRLRIGNNRKLGLPGYQALIDSTVFEPAELLVGKVGDQAARAALHQRYGDRVRFE